jgi:hypothetical protein
MLPGGASRAAIAAVAHNLTFISIQEGPVDIPADFLADCKSLSSLDLTLPARASLPDELFTPVIKTIGVVAVMVRVRRRAVAP